MKFSAKYIIKYSLAFLIVIGFFVLLFLLSVKPVPETNKDMFNILIGCLASAFAGIVGFYFGSSQSSADKTELLNQKKDGV